MEVLQQFFRGIPAPGLGIVKERCLDLLARGTAYDPDEGFTAGLLACFFIALDPGLIHVEHAACCQLFKDPPVKRLQPFLTAPDAPVCHDIPWQDQPQPVPVPFLPGERDPHHELLVHHLGDQGWGGQGMGQWRNRDCRFLEMAIGILRPIRTAYRTFRYLLYNLPDFQFCGFKLHFCPDDPLSDHFEFPAAFAAGLPFRNGIFFDFCLRAGKPYTRTPGLRGVRV